MRPVPCQHVLCQRGPVQLPDGGHLPCRIDVRVRLRVRAWILRVGGRVRQMSCRLLLRWRIEIGMPCWQLLSSRSRIANDMRIAQR